MKRVITPTKTPVYQGTIQKIRAKIEPKILSFEFLQVFFFVFLHSLKHIK